MKHIIKIISLVFTINFTQILASDYSTEINSDDPIDINSDAPDEINSNDPNNINSDYSIDINQVQADLKSRFANAESLSSGSPVAQFYRNRQYRPVWVEEGGISLAGEHALATFENADGEGLEPNDYKSAIQAVDEIENYPERATKAEIAMTKMALKYIDDVNGNRVNPQKVPKELYVKKSVIPPLKILIANMNSDPSGAWLESYTFNNPHYQALKRFLTEYRRLQQALRYKDRGTAQKIQQIVINMERWRWFPEKMPERYAMVNIAAFDLKCIENDKVVLEMPVVVGMHQRKTPVLISTVDSIRFNPSWNLPRHIAIEDSLPKIKANPEYINHRKYVLSNSAGQVVSPYSVNWAAVHAGNFNFHLRQVPGEHNALGKIRFGLTDSQNIYMHDTADKEYFDQPIRAYSSGCIRLKHPDQFAFFLFNDPQAWPIDRIRENMEGILTKNVPLDQSLPVYITYFTVSDKEGQIHFADDVYDRDQQLLEILHYPFNGIF